MVSLAVIIFGVVLPRVLVFGGYPMGDEGTYATLGLVQYVSPGSDSGSFWLYSRLFSFVYAFEGNHIFYLRLVDLLVASIAGFLLFSIAQIISLNNVIAILVTMSFLLAMNQFGFIYRGFSNPIYAAYIFLFGALYLLLNSHQISSRIIFFVGFLLGVAVLFREPFVSFALAVGLYVLTIERVKNTIFYIAGGLTALVAALLVLRINGVSPETILASYQDVGQMYAQLRENYSPPGSLERFIQLTWPILSLFGLVSAIYLYSVYKNDKAHVVQSKWFFFVLLAFAPLIEPALKYSQPYTFALSLPGLLMATIVALNYLVKNEILNPTRIVIPILLLMVVFFGYQHVKQMPNKILWGGSWDGWLTAGFQNDRYLKASLAVARVSKANDTVAMTGDLYPIFPVTVRAPVHLEMTDLDRTVVKLGLTAEQLSGLLKQCTPDSIFLSSEQLKTSRIVAEAIELTNMYDVVGRIESPSAGYGRSGAFVIRLKDEYYKAKSQKFCKKNIREYL